MSNTVIVVVGPRCWGSGQSMQQAVANARRNYPTYGEKKPMPYNAYRASEDFLVDYDGTIEAQTLEKLCEVRYEDDVKVTTFPDGTKKRKGVKA